MVRHLSAILLGVALLAGVRVGADAAAAVRDLGDGSYQTRKQARALLAELGWEAKQELELAAKSPDPEVADVARELLAEMVPGVTRSTPEEERRIAARYAKAPNAGVARNCAKELAARRPVPQYLLFDLLEWERDHGRRRALFDEILNVAETLHYEGLADGDAGAFERLLQWGVRLEATSAIPHIAAHAFLRGRLEEMRRETAELVGRNPTPFLRRLLVELHVLAGADEAAVAVARDLEDRPLLEGVLVRTGRWQELAALLLEKMGEAQGAQRFQLAAAQRLAGDERLALETIAGVLGGKKDEGGEQAAPGGIRIPEAALADMEFQFVDVQGGLFQGQFDLDAFAAVQMPAMGRGRRVQTQKVPIWRFLLAYGLTEDALRAMEEDKGGMGDAVTVLLHLNRYREADRLLRKLAEDAEPPEKWLFEVRRAGILRELGDESAEGAARKLLERCRAGDENLAQTHAYSAALRAIASAGFDALLRESLPELLARFEGADVKEARGWATMLGPQATAAVAVPWWDLLAKEEPALALAERAKRLREFLHGRLPEAESDAILRLALLPEAAAKQRIEGLLLVATTCVLLDRRAEGVAAHGLALRQLAGTEDRALASRVDESAYRVFAPILDWRALADRAGRLAEREAPRWWALERASMLSFAGDGEPARRLLGRALAVTTGSGSAASMLPRLVEVGWTEEVRRLLPLGATPEAARAAGEYALELRLAQQIWYHQICQPMHASGESMLSANAGLLGAECRAMIGTRPPAEALERAKRVNDLFPGDIDGLADTVEAFDRAGLRAEGDQLVARALEREASLLDKLPEAVQHLNNAAWLCARTGRELARGEDYVRRAIRRTPDRDAYLDTLALALHRQGDREGAIETARKCLRIDPYDSHHLFQLGRWLRESRN